MYSVSFIIPIYNTRAFIDRAIRSIISLNRSDIELILIDDGSADGVAEDIPHYAEICNFNVLYSYQENKGISSARNKGLDMASGEYVYFFDSDDFILSEGFNELIEVAQLTSADIICGNVMIDHQGKYLYWGNPIITTDECYDVLAKEQYCDLLNRFGAYVPMVFNYLYKRSFIEKTGLLYHDGIIHEDELWSPSCFFHAGSVAVSSARHYVYCFRPDSIMASADRMRRAESLEIVLAELNQLLQKSIDKSEHAIFRTFLTAQINRLIRVKDTLVSTK